jgi:hypothetical protein
MDIHSKFPAISDASQIITNISAPKIRPNSIHSSMK